MKAKSTQIALTESGGFTGIIRHYGCSLGDLPAPQAAQLLGLFERPTDVSPPESPLRDALQYSLAIHSDADNKHCDLSPEQATQYAQLINTIRQLHRKSMP